MYNDYEREELEAEYFAEDPGAVAARRHNEWEAHWARLEAEEEERLNEENEKYNAMCQQYEDDLLHYEDNVDF